MKKKYFTKDIAIVIPTKNRAFQLNRLFKSLESQDERAGCIIVVDSGGGLESIIDNFKSELNIIYIFSEISGQIHQRNLGINHALSHFPLIGFVDDDLVFEPESLIKMIEFWNEGVENIAGIGFNITNAPAFSKNKILQFFGLAGTQPGEVLSSGLNSSINSISSNIKSEWLGGGYTVWNADILKKFPQETLKTSWAIGEDLRFSYPIGKIYGLYVCSDAKVLQQDLFEAVKPTYFTCITREKKSYISQLYFAQINPNDLSLIQCYWMLSWKLIFRFLDGLVRFNSVSLLRSLGAAIGLILGFACLVTQKSLETLLHD